MSATGIRRLHEIACAAYAQQPLSRAEIDAVLAHARNTGATFQIERNALAGADLRVPPGKTPAKGHHG